MKILFITSGTVQSSISYRAVAFAKELSKRGHTLYIIAPKFDKYSHFADRKITRIGKIRIIRPIQPFFLPFQISLIPYMITAIFLLLYTNPDIVHIYKANPITAIGLFLKLLRHKKVIYDTDDLDSEVMKIEKNPKTKIYLVKISEYLLSKYSDAIITGSRYLYDKYHALDLKKNIMHIPNGAEFNIRKKETKKFYKNKIVFIGNINRTNILLPLFRALHNLKKRKIKLQALLIGDGSCLSYFRTLSKKLQLDKEIEFVGRVPQKDLYKFVNKGDIGYCYMPNENVQKACSNMKIFQYMQHNVVPVVSAVGDLPLYTYYGKAGYIATNQMALEACIKAAMEDKTDRQKKVNFIQEHAKKNYSWSVLSKTVERFYKTIYEK